MSRGARRRDPALPTVKRIELDESRLPLRIFALVFSLIVAAAAFGYFLNTVLSTEPGWQEIKAGAGDTGIHESFVLNYNLGAGEMDATAEGKAVSTLYTASLDYAYKVLSNADFAPYQNIYYLNRHPNEPVAVDPILYRALQTLEQAGSRYLYYGPAMEFYRNLYRAQYDEQAMEADPAFDSAALDYVSQIARFASDPDAVSIRLLGDNQVQLSVSDAYAAFLRSNEVGSIVDFGILENAFVLDAAAGALCEQGYSSGVISSSDGYARALCSENFSVNLFGLRNGELIQEAAVSYAGPMAIASFRSFPMLQSDEQRYYTYADGTVRGPYLSAEAIPAAAGEQLTVFSRGMSCGYAAALGLAAYTSAQSTPQLPDSLSWALSRSGQVTSNGDLITLKPMR